eukprot:scaffold472473_cov33-Prasinocladus_malaysianus.AAC.1
MKRRTKGDSSGVDGPQAASKKHPVSIQAETLQQIGLYNAFFEREEQLRVDKLRKAGACRACELPFDLKTNSDGACK